jgi:putative membrane protein
MKTVLSILCGISVVGFMQFSNPVQQDSPDSKFVANAAEGGLLEVQLGELAQKNGMSSEIKDFGKTMVTDHSKVNDELKALAKRKNIKVPATLSAAKKQKYDSLAAMKGEKFDMLYMNMMIASHEQTIGLFQTESNKGQDAELKKWADLKVPALKHHLEMAMKLFQHSPNASQH